MLRKLNTRVPRVGNHVIAPEDELIESIQQLVPNLKVHHAEACKGVNRLRIPVGSYNPREVTHRYTVVMNRHNGEIEADDNVEHWAVLPKYKQVRAGKPARIALTMFGVLPEQVPVNPETSPVGDTSSRTRSAVSMTPVDPEPTESKIAWGPPPIANHGPAFLKLSPEERGDLRQLHHNLGHPDPQKMMRYLRHGGADKGVQQAALEYQCDACAESRKGFTAARPSAIHENLAFNTKVGMDLVTWRNAKGHDFHFVHFLDESTLFHLGSECRGGASEVMEHFETVWANWAGYPQEVYVDPGGEFVSDAFAVRMQETGVHVKMSASDSHWQLGRTEIHGSTVKGMLSKMDLEKAIDSSLDFQAALCQVFHAKTAKNTLCRADGYTPQQSVLGISPRLPGSLLSDSNAAPHALADSATKYDEDKAQYQAWLEEAQAGSMRPLFRTVKSHEATTVRPFGHVEPGLRPFLRFIQWQEIWGATDSAIEKVMQLSQQQAKEEAKELKALTGQDYLRKFRKLPNKAPGPDGWTVQVLRALPLQACEWIAEVCRKVELTGEAPAQWTVSLVVLMAKKPQIERPIALCHVVYKAWVKARYYLVERWLEGFADKAPWDAASKGKVHGVHSTMSTTAPVSDVRC